MCKNKLHNIYALHTFHFKGAIYLKNLIYQSWTAREGEPNKFTVHEQDRAIVRDTILDVIVQVPELLRYFIFYLFFILVLY